MNIPSTYTLEGVFSVSNHSSGKSYNITYDNNSSKWGTVTFANVRGCDLNTVLSLLKIYDTIMGIGAVNEDIGFCVGGIPVPFTTTIDNLINIIDNCVMTALCGDVDEVMSYEFVEKELTRLMSPAGFKEIEEEKIKAAYHKQRFGGGSRWVQLNKSPTTKFIVSFVMVWVNSILTDTPYYKGLNFRAPRKDIPERDIHSIVYTEFVCEDESTRTGTWTIGVVGGTDGGPIPKEMFMDGEKKKSKKRKKGKKGRGKR